MEETMIKKIAHLAIVVSDLEKEIKKYRDILGLACLGIEEVEAQKVRVALFDVGGVHIELVAPLSHDSPVSNFLKKRGGGIHHIAYEVENLETQMQVFKKKGLRLLDSEAGKGASGTRIVFVHPGDMSGVLTELVEKKQVSTGDGEKTGDCRSDIGDG